ncbi:MAG: hypothetical protein KDD67_06715 [Ignavibacteriae bacterium]|nr:hypothetical protein [Ignavibacteriota bacterium]MCB9215629.1 hypothetical protein [Ignavibacteria bacterium]
MTFNKLLLAPLLAFTFVFSSCEYFMGKPDITLEEARNTLVAYLMYRQHGGENFEKQLYPDANPVMFDPRDQVIYFALPIAMCDEGTKKTTMQKYVDSLEKVTWSGRNRNNIVGVGRYRAYLSEDLGCACHTPVSNLTIDTAKILHFPYTNATYTITLRELAENLDNRYSYFLTEPSTLQNSMAYYGTLVAMKEEPSLTRLVDTLLQNLMDEEKQREERIQKLLDFVSNDIHSPAVNENGFAPVDPPRRSTETLMFGKGAGENKSILFASLLEQIGEEYLFVIVDSDLSVAIPRGNFPKSNGHIFKWRDREWVSCEPSIPGFKIGIDYIPDYYTFAEITWLQRPSDPRGFYDPRSGKIVPFY